MSSRLRIVIFLGVLVFWNATLYAERQVQEPPPDAVILMRKINQAFLKRVHNVLALTPDQSPKVEAVMNQFIQQRGILERENRQLHNAVERLLEPGVNAKPLRMNQLLDQINANELAYAATWGNEIRDLAPVLSPMQRLQFRRLNDQFQQQLRNAQQIKPAPKGPPPGRVGPGPGRGAPLRNGRVGGGM